MAPVRSFIDLGVKPTVESFGRASMEMLEKLVTRRNETGRLWGEYEKVNRRQALWMMTNGSSRYTGEQDVVGTIETGKWADFVVLSGDYLTVPEDEISELKILMTVTGGKILYRNRSEAAGTPANPLLQDQKSRHSGDEKRLKVGPQSR